ncbi:site-specific DNA-methyltransferase [Staphylococcus xylosus]|uniref:site-specific DNA-methyltransferase n=1 Tax=Staphylococcus xylosus TaxID=1288 RepID=UPI003F561B39
MSSLYKNELLEKLRKNFPEFFSDEDKFDYKKFEEHLNDNEIATDLEGFNLKFLGKEYSKIITDQPPNTIIKPDLSHNKEIQNKDSENLYLVGNNLEVLKHLRRSYHDKVDLIYIDPPYNTKKKDFAYNDKFEFDLEQLSELVGDQEKAEKIFRLKNKSSHSAWLTFMYPRLKLAHSLLNDNGVIIVSIDDNEQANLKLILDEIFGEDNFIGQIIHKTATDNNPGQLKVEHEYFTIYAKNKNEQYDWIGENLAAKTINEYYQALKKKHNDNIETIQKELRSWIKKNEKDLPKSTHYDNVDERGVFHDGDAQNTKAGGYEYDVIHPVTKKKVKQPTNGYRFPKSTYNEMLERGDIVFGKDETTYIKPKKRIEDAKSLLRSIIYEDGRSSSKRVETLVGKGVFPHPKSDTVLKTIIEHIINKDSLVLDFFAGSSTTADAVLQLNYEKNMNLRYIMVQIAEEVKEKSMAYKAGYRTIDEIGKKRIEAVIELLKENGDLEINKYGFKKYDFVESESMKLENIVDFDEDLFKQESFLFENILDNYGDYENEGQNTILSTWLNQDGFGLGVDPELVYLKGYDAYRFKDKLYLINNDFNTHNLEDMLNKIDNKELNINSIVVLSENFSFISLKELDIAIKARTGINIERRRF